jgi:beta-glucanase (GH16 family)
MIALVALAALGVVDGSNWASACDEPGWVTTFQDDFDGPMLNASSWVAINNVTHGPAEKQLYLADDVFVRDGALVLRTRKRQAWHKGVRYNFTSGWVHSMSRRFQAYGRFEVTAKLPSPGAGRTGKWPTAWPAHWLMPEPSTSIPPNLCWPVGGEIDIMEGFRSRLGPEPFNHSSVLLSYHWATECGKDLWQSENMIWPPIDDAATTIDWTHQFHRFAIDWSHEALTWLVDGVPRYTRTREDPMAGFFIPSEPFYMILNTALTPWADAELDSGLPLEHTIDQVRWCKRA